MESRSLWENPCFCENPLPPPGTRNGAQLPRAVSSWAATSGVEEDTTHQGLLGGWKERALCPFAPDFCTAEQKDAAPAAAAHPDLNLAQQQQGSRAPSSSAPDSLEFSTPPESPPSSSSWAAQAGLGAAASASASAQQLVVGGGHPAAAAMAPVESRLATGQPQPPRALPPFPHQQLPVVPYAAQLTYLQLQKIQAFQATGGLLVRLPVAEHLHPCFVHREGEIEYVGDLEMTLSGRFLLAKPLSGDPVPSIIDIGCGGTEILPKVTFDFRKLELTGEWAPESGFSWPQHSIILRGEQPRQLRALQDSLLSVQQGCSLDGGFRFVDGPWFCRPQRSLNNLACSSEAWAVKKQQLPPSGNSSQGWIKDRGGLILEMVHTYNHKVSKGLPCAAGRPAGMSSVYVPGEGLELTPWPAAHAAIAAAEGGQHVHVQVQAHELRFKKQPQWVQLEFTLCDETRMVAFSNGLMCVVRGPNYKPKINRPKIPMQVRNPFTNRASSLPPPLRAPYLNSASCSELLEKEFQVLAMHGFPGTRDCVVQGGYLDEPLQIYDSQIRDWQWSTAVALPLTYCRCHGMEGFGRGKFWGNRMWVLGHCTSADPCRCVCTKNDVGYCCGQHSLALFELPVCVEDDAWRHRRLQLPMDTSRGMVCHDLAVGRDGHRLWMVGARRPAEQGSMIPHVSVWEVVIGSDVVTLQVLLTFLPSLTEVCPSGSYLVDVKTWFMADGRAHVIFKGHPQLLVVDLSCTGTMQDHWWLPMSPVLILREGVYERNSEFFYDAMPLCPSKDAYVSDGAMDRKENMRKLESLALKRQQDVLEQRFAGVMR